jgi:hypothetical protein
MNYFYKIIYFLNKMLLSLLLLLPLTFAMPIIDLNDGGGNWDNIPVYTPPTPTVPTVPVVPINNPLPIPTPTIPLPFQSTPVVQPVVQQPPVSYDLGAPLYNTQYQVVPQFQIPQVVPQYPQVPQVVPPQFQVPQYQVPQPIETPVLPPQAQPTDTVPQPPPTTFPKAD